MYIDTHSHLNFKDFDDDRDEVIKKSLESDVFMINIGSDYESSVKAVEIAKQYQNGVYASIALHPIHTKDEVFSYEKYKDLAKSSKKVKAIGEIGLDAMHPNSEQEPVFLEQLELAKELNLPVILHCRKAHQYLIEILSTPPHPSAPSRGVGRGRQANGVVHCFTGNWEEAQKYMELGFYLGFNGIIFKFDVEETIKKMPLEKMLLETDCPYLSPEPLNGQRNEPANIRYIAQKIAEIRGESLETIAQTTTQNAKNLFDL